jgi:general secretion pathway protein D
MLARLCVSVAAVAAFAAADTALIIEPGTVSVSVGDTFTLDVLINDVVDLFAYEFRVAFDPAILAVDGTTGEGSFLSSGGSASTSVPGEIVNSAGFVFFPQNRLLGPGPGVSGSGLLASILFRAIGPGESIVFPTNPLELLDSRSNSINWHRRVGVVTVQSPVTVPEPYPWIAETMTVAMTFCIATRDKIRLQRVG